MRARLPEEFFDFLRTAGKEADEREQELYLVGGTVRDLILNRPNLDFDLVLEGDAIKFARQLANKTGAKLTVHPRFGTANFSHDKFHIDIVTARSETYTEPGALPTVVPGTMCDDLRRRDFSINAIAADLGPDSFGQILDPHDGIRDIEKKFIRVLHNKSFIDDATRMLRAIRYEQRLDFKLEKDTERLLRKNVGMLDTISGDRIRHEIDRTLREEHSEKALKRAKDLGLLQRINPSLKGDVRLAGRFAEARKRNISGHMVYLALLAYDLGSDDADALCERLNLSGEWKRIIQGVAKIKDEIDKLADPSIPASHIYRFFKRYPAEAVSACLIANDSQIIRSQIERYLNDLQYMQTALNGDDLKAMGMEPGPRLGRMLSSLRDAKMDGVVRTREDEEALVRQRLQNQ